MAKVYVVNGLYALHDRLRTLAHGLAETGDLDKCAASERRQYEADVCLKAARLIPDLYEALNELMPEGEGWRDGTMDHMPGIAKARAAADETDDCAAPVVADPIARFAERSEAQIEWLREHYPTITDEQKHLDDGSEARGYWHYGYAAALRDVVAALKRGSEVKN